MGRFDNLDYEKAKEEGEKAAEDLSMFIAKRMKKDLDTIHVMFLELPSFGSVIYDGKASTKGQANVASYDKETGEYEGVFLLEMALKHMKRFLLKLEKPKYGIEKLYEIERHGVPNDTETYYEQEIIRDMTPEELEFLETVPFYDRFSKRTDDSTPAPATSTTPPPATTLAEDDKAFMKQCAGEAVRLGWAPDKESLKTAIVVANKTFFGNFIPSADMTPGQKEQFLERLREMTPGQAYGEIGTAPMEDAPLNLDEDVDFF